MSDNVSIKMRRRDAEMLEELLVQISFVANSALINIMINAIDAALTKKKRGRP